MTDYENDIIGKSLQFVVQARERNDANWVYFNCMTAQDKRDFDLFLCSTAHPLAFQPGTNEFRFKKFVEIGIF